MSRHNEILEGQQLQLESVESQLEVLEEHESHYSNSFSKWLFVLILCIEVGGVVSLAYQHDYQKDHEKLIKAVATASLPVALTVGCCFAIAHKFGIEQEQKRLSAKYRSLLEQGEDD